jgi:hypothetical protein
VLEEFAEHAVETFRPRVGAVGHGRAVVGVADGVEDLAADRGGIVGFEVAHRAWILLRCIHGKARYVTWSEQMVPSHKSTIGQRSAL